jgi:hypothetical protein
MSAASADDHAPLSANRPQPARPATRPRCSRVPSLANPGDL